MIAGYNDREDEDMQVEQPAVTPGYFATMQVPLLAGRDFTDDDVVGKPNVAIVNVAFARHFFGTPQNALGHFLGFDGSRGKKDTEIVGVVGDTRHARVRDDVKRTVYRPRFQLDNPSGLFFLVRTWQPPEAALSDIRGAMQQLDSKLALVSLQTMEVQIADNLSVERLVALLAVCFGVLAMLLAAIGLYGVLAYATAQRTREIGIRMALGAQRGSVMGLVLRDVLWLAGISIVATLAGGSAVGAPVAQPALWSQRRRSPDLVRRHAAGGGGGPAGGVAAGAAGGVGGTHAGAEDGMKKPLGISN